MSSRPVSPFSFAPTTPNIRPVSRQSFISTLAPARVSVVENEDVILISRLAHANSEDAGQRPAETQKHGEEVEIPVRDAIRPASRASSRQSRRQRVISAASSRISLRSGAGGEERQLGKRKLSVWSRGSAANLPYTAEEGGKDGGKTMGKANWEYEFEDDEELEQAMDEDYERYLKKLTDLRLKQRRSWLLSKAKEEVGLRILPKPNLPINRPAPPLYPLHSPYSRPTSALSSHEHRPTSPLSQYSEDTRSNGPGRRMSNETSLSYGTSSMGPRTPVSRTKGGQLAVFYAESSRHGHASNASDSSHGHTKNGRPSTSLGFHGAGHPSAVSCDVSILVPRHLFNPASIDT
ncbi:hypothetical protein BT69DRAFT_300014 [Atractiella rhizophila]|nr:hypothetical protein BT69DRAFT_300014 [Atractiella rhizophila]